MREETKQLRHEAIGSAAYALIAEKGYDGASMLSIAKAARASNETLYRWYGDKQGLFRALVSDNAAETAQALGQAIQDHEEPFETLAKVAPVFLTMLLGERAILLNRAAASEPTGALGGALSAGGREVVQPLFQKVMMRLTGGDEAKANCLTGTFLGLLIGDLQIKRVIGVQSVLTQAQIDDRVEGALAALRKLAAK